MSSMNFTCDVCGREVFSCTFVNGMKFCAKCYQETFGETDKNRKIADLEAKLAEKDEEIKKLNACVDFYKSYSVSFQEKVIDELERVKEHFINIKTPTLGVIRRSEMVMYIDNQINVLRNNKDGIH